MSIKTCVALVLVGFVLVGCSSTPKLMPTPNIFLNGGKYPGQSVPPSLRSNQVNLFYVTDRVPESFKDGTLVYGSQRSASLGFGSAIVEIGKDLSWDQLVTMSEVSP